MKHEIPSVEPPAPAEPDNGPDEAYGATDQNGGYGEEYHEDNYDDDDDVDFNLGNGSTNNGAAPPQQEVSTPNFHSARGSSSKEDG